MPDFVDMEDQPHWATVAQVAQSLKMWQHVPGYDMSGLMCHV